MGYREQRRETERLRALRSEVVEMLGHLPGSVASAWGVRQRNQLSTGAPASRIYFERKRPRVPRSTISMCPNVWPHFNDSKLVVAEARAFRVDPLRARAFFWL